MKQQLKILSLVMAGGFLTACQKNEPTQNVSPSVKPASQESVGVKAPRPNILFILADDLGYADVGFNGSPDIVTPNLDQLAKEGTVLTSGYVTHPFCGPSRAALMTGRYPHKIGSQFNLPHLGSEQGVSTHETFISKVLHDAGYYTGAMGKWHLGENPEFHPNKRGYDEFFGFLGGGHSYFPEQYRAKYEAAQKRGAKHIWSYLYPMEHNGQKVHETEYVTDALSREGVKFIEKAGQDDKPFFLYMAYNAPHTPLEAKAEDMAKFPDIKDKNRKTYAGMVYGLDRGVGKLVTALKQTGQFENTLILFMSDNGGRPDKGANNFPLKEGKNSVYEGGYRTPMFFHWPEVVKAGQTYDYPVTALDLYPTFAALAGAKIPADKKLDGKDIWPDFMAGTSAHKGQMIYTMVQRPTENLTNAAGRRDEWKVVRMHGQPWQLFNIEKDKEEQHDLSAQHPEMVREMVKQIEGWSKTNEKPLWFYSQEESELWRQQNMPHWDALFTLKAEAE